MGKIKEQLIDTFSGGISEDKRVKDFSKFSLTKHFDSFSYPHKLVPQLRTKAFEGENKTLDIVKFVYAPRSSTLFRLFGLGKTGASTAEIKINDVDNSADDSWGTPNNNVASNGNRSEDIFFHYKNYIYMYSNGANLDRFDVTSAAAFGNAYQTIAYTTTEWQAAPVHHLADDTAYFFADNVVHKLNNVTFTSAALTLPSTMLIRAACQYGNYLAIGCVQKGTFDKKITVFLWDRDSSLSTLAERIDFGEGELRHLVNLDNKLIGIVEYYSASSLAQKNGRIYIKQANGTSAVVLNELTLDATSSVGQDVGGNNVACQNTRVLRNNKLYFPASATLDSDTRMGIWSVDSFGRLSLEVVEEEATSYEGIISIANQWWIAHSNDGSTNRSIIVDGGDNPNYSTTLSSIYETLIINGGDSTTKGDSSKTKKLIGVTVITEPLPTAGQVVLKYRKNEETAWTTIFTDTTDNSISHSAINIESSGANLPTFKEIQFQINSTGGAIITGLKYRWEDIENDLY